MSNKGEGHDLVKYVLSPFFCEGKYAKRISRNVFKSRRKRI